MWHNTLRVHCHLLLCDHFCMFTSTIQYIQGALPPTAVWSFLYVHLHNTIHSGRTVTYCCVITSVCSPPQYNTFRVHCHLLLCDHFCMFTSTIQYIQGALSPTAVWSFLYVHLHNTTHSGCTVTYCCVITSVCSPPQYNTFRVHCHLLLCDHFCMLTSTIQVIHCALSPTAVWSFLSVHLHNTTHLGCTVTYCCVIISVCSPPQYNTFGVHCHLLLCDHFCLFTSTMQHIQGALSPTAVWSLLSSPPQQNTFHQNHKCRNCQCCCHNTYTYPIASAVAITLTLIQLITVYCRIKGAVGGWRILGLCDRYDLCHLRGVCGSSHL